MIFIYFEHDTNTLPRAHQRQTYNEREKKESLQMKRTMLSIW